MSLKDAARPSRIRRRKHEDTQPGTARISPFGCYRLTCLAAACIALASCSSQAGLLLVDDSYTVSQRFAAHKGEYPEIAWPTVSVVSGQSIQFDLPYKEVSGRTLHADVFTPPPELQNKMAVILVHGGGWRSGNKSHFYPLANLLAQRGYVVVVPEYRLSVEETYPAAVIDITDSVAWTKQQSSVYGFDTDMVAIGGGSSGGQLAALVAYTADSSLYRPSPASDQSLLALIDLDGVLDFTTPLALANENLKKDKSAAGLWLEGSFEKQRSRWIEASPVRHIGAGAPPTLIMSSGQARFTAGSDEVLAKLSALGVRSQYIELENVLHTFWLFDPYLTKTAEDVHAFLSLVASDKELEAAGREPPTSGEKSEGE